MIRLDNVKVKYKDKVALDLGRVIEIKDGEKVGVIGSNGAGKTTLIKSILGLVPYEGNITLGIPKNKIAVHMQQNEYIDTVPIKTESMVRIVLDFLLKRFLKAISILSLIFI